MNIIRLISVGILCMIIVIVGAAQDGKKTGPPKPNGPLDAKDVPNKPPLKLLPDLLTRDIKRLKAGSPRIAIYVVNQGMGTAAASNGFYTCSWEGKVTPELVSFSVPALPAKSSKPVVVECKGAGGKKLSVSVTLDGDKKIAEANEDNNMFYKQDVQ